MNDQFDFGEPSDYGRVTLKRGPMADDLFWRHPTAFRLLTLIALRINWRDLAFLDHTEVGEALINPRIARLTPSAFKAALAQLLKWDQIEIAHTKTGVGTVVRLTKESIYEMAGE